MICSNSGRHDLAMIKLQSPFNFGKEISKVELPKLKYDYNGFGDAPGWAPTLEQNNSGRLMVHRLLMFKRSECIEAVNLAKKKGIKIGKFYGDGYTSSLLLDSVICTEPMHNLVQDCEVKNFSLI